MNKFQFMGRLTKDVEIKYTTTTNTQVSLFTLAVNRRYVEQGKERETDFFNLTSFGKTAEFIGKYFKKGQQVLVEGRIQNRTYENDGQKRYITDFIVEQCYFADSNKNTKDETAQSTLEDDFITVDETESLPF